MIAVFLGLTARPVSGQPIRSGDEVRAFGLGAIAPPPGFGIQASAIFLDGGGSTLRVESRSPDDVRVSGNRGSSASRTDASPDDLAEEVQACVQVAEILADYHFDFDLSWKYNSSSQPTGLGITPLTAIKNAGDAIAEVDNSCQHPDWVGATHTYQGSTSAAPQIDSAGSCTGTPGDGISAVGWGYLPSFMLAHNCYVYTAQVPHGNIVEVDIKFNTNHVWFTGTPPILCSDKFDIQSVATHEFLNGFGIADAPESVSGALSVSTGIRECSTSPRTLGYGDWKGMEWHYPE